MFIPDPEAETQCYRDYLAAWERARQRIVDPASGFEDDYGLNDPNLGDADRPAVEAMPQETRGWPRGGFRLLNQLLPLSQWQPRWRWRLRPPERLMHAVRKEAIHVRCTALLSPNYGEEKRSELSSVNGAAQRSLAELYDEYQMVRPQVLPGDEYVGPLTKGEVCRVLRAASQGRWLTENDSRLFRDKVRGAGVHVIQVSVQKIMINLTQLRLAFPELTDDHVEPLRGGRKKEAA